MIPTSVLALLGLLATAHAVAPPASSEPRPEVSVASEGIRLYNADDPGYRALQIPERSAPEAFHRLVVFRGGTAVFDRGLRNEKAAVPLPGGEPPTEEEGYVEDAEVSEDGRYAIVLSTRYRKPLGRAAEATKGKTELTWIDPPHPRGLWSVLFEEGRWVKSVLPLSLRQGVAVATVTDAAGPADLRLYGPEGTEKLRLKAEEGSVIDMRSATDGAFLAVGLAYADRTGLPNRGIAVLDLPRGTRWDYTWSYGGDGEPLSWTLADTGVLEITTPGGTQSFDRNGKPLQKTRRK